jgi:hypothetical protein
MRIEEMPKPAPRGLAFGKPKSAPAFCPWLLAIALASLLLGPNCVCYGQSEIPSLNNNRPIPPVAGNRSSGTISSGTPQLPSSAGQVWKTYDLRPYSNELKEVDRPHQAIVDWILRETGTDVWFTDPFGILNADRDTLHVYHNPQMHDVVAEIYEKFVNGTTAPQRYGLRVMAVANPNWRTRAQSLMRTVQAQSPGVHAYLLSKENSAIFMSLLRGRADFRELSSVDVVVHNGQAQVLEQVRGRNFVSGFQPAAGAWPPYIPTTGEIREGYRLHLSPLLSVNRDEVDLMIKCNIDQVERLTNVNLDLPLTNGQVYQAQMNVPQVASWRLHERFKWPSDQVLLLSCGVVAAPDGAPDNSLLGRGGGLLGISRLLSPGAGRADALLMIEYRGDAKDQLATVPNPSSAAKPTSPLSRGRY